MQSEKPKTSALCFLCKSEDVLKKLEFDHTFREINPKSFFFCSKTRKRCKINNHCYSSDGFSIFQ